MIQYSKNKQEINVLFSADRKELSERALFYKAALYLLDNTHSKE
jgi:hypothetical protein